MGLDLPRVGIMNQLVARTDRVPALVAAAGDRAQTRFWEFFVSNIRNPHTRRAYGRSIAEFLAWHEQHVLPSIINVEPLHAGTYIEAFTRSNSAPPAKQKFAAIHMSFDWLETARSCRPVQHRACGGRSTPLNSARRRCSAQANSTIHMGIRYQIEISRLTPHNQLRQISAFTKAISWAMAYGICRNP